MRASWILSGSEEAGGVTAEGDMVNNDAPTTGFL